MRERVFFGAIKYRVQVKHIQLVATGQEQSNCGPDEWSLDAENLVHVMHCS